MGVSAFKNIAPDSCEHTDRTNCWHNGFRKRAHTWNLEGKLVVQDGEEFKEKKLRKTWLKHSIYACMHEILKQKKATI